MRSNHPEKSLGALSLRAGIVTVLVLVALTILLKTGVISREQDVPAKIVEAMSGIIQDQTEIKSIRMRRWSCSYASFFIGRPELPEAAGPFLP